MKLEIERQDFLKAWQISERFAGTKTAIQSTSGIFITADIQYNQHIVTLEATDLKTSVKCKAKGVNIIEPGTAVLPVALLGSLLKKIKAEKIIIEVNNERGVLTAGKSKTRFTIIPVSEFPGIPKSESSDEICEIMNSDFIKLINEGTSASSAPADFPKYLGTCLLRTRENFIKSVSTDGKRLSLSQALCNVKKTEDLLLPAQALKDLAKIIPSSSDKDKNEKNENDDALPVIKIFADGSTVWFRLDEIEFSIRRIESNFPAYERILNSEVRTTLKINSDEFYSALDRIDVIAKTTPAHIAAITLKPDKDLKITTRSPELGISSEIIDSNEAKVEGGYMQIGFNVSYLQDGLKAMGPCEVLIEFSDEEGQARLLRNESDDFLYMLMPARLSPQDLVSDEEISDFESSGNQENQEDQENENFNENEILNNQDFNNNQDQDLNQENQEF